MDSPSIIPRMQKDVRRAWQIKSLADLALIAGSPLDAAKFALLASAELNVLHNVRRYSAAISTWCAAVLTCLKEVDNNDSLRFLLKNIPNLAGFHKMRSVDYTACLRETLRTYVHRCTLEVLWKLFKSGVNFVHLAAVFPVPLYNESLHKVFTGNCNENVSFVCLGYTFSVTKSRC